MDAFADAMVGAAATNVAGHGIVYVLVGGVGVVAQQYGGRHDLAGVAVAALGYVNFLPGLLERVAVIGREPLNGYHLLAFCAAQRGDAGAYSFTVEVHYTGAALGHAAAVLGAGEPDEVPNGPQKRHIGVGIQLINLLIDRYGNHGQWIESGEGSNDGDKSILFQRNFIQMLPPQHHGSAAGLYFVTAIDQVGRKERRLITLCFLQIRSSTSNLQI